METDQVTPKKVKKTADMKAYMREYMRNRYEKNPEQSRSRMNSQNIKKRIDVPKDDTKRFGIHLADVYTIRKIKARLPPELFQEIMNEGTNPSVEIENIPPI
jgi:hypothetical protein